VGALIVVLIIATVVILVIIALRKRRERPKKYQQQLHWSPENASKEAKQTLQNPAYGAGSDSKSNGPAGTNEPEHLLMNPLYTIPTSGKNTLSPYTTEGDVAHTYEGIQETKPPFTYKSNAGPHRPHPMPSHLELGNPDEEREYATLRSPGHEYATLEQPSHTQGQNHQKPRPYEFPVANGAASKTGSVALNGNHQYEKPEPQRPIPNYPPQGYEEIVAMASGRREYAEPDLDTPHSYATLEPPASK